MIRKCNIEPNAPINIVPSINSLSVLPFEIFTIKLPTNGDKASHQAQ